MPGQDNPVPKQCVLMMHYNLGTLDWSNDERWTMNDEQRQSVMNCERWTTEVISFVHHSSFRIHRFFMDGFDLGKFALLWGPGIVVLGVFSFTGAKLAQYWIDKAMEQRRKQMEGTFDIARTYLDQIVGAQRLQSDAFTRLAATIEQEGSKTGFEHQEMLTAIKALHRHVEGLARQKPVSSGQ
jgi:hypothetical protein